MPESGSHGLHHFLNWADKNPSINYQSSRFDGRFAISFVTDSLTELASVANAIGDAWLTLGKLQPSGTNLSTVRGVAWGISVDIIAREPMLSAVRVGRAA